MNPPYTYAATIIRVTDADTLVADLDLGFGVWVRSQPYRLVGCNAIEKSKPGGREAAAYLTQLLPPGTWVLLSSVHADKYGGRWDARITVPDLGDLATHLITEGWAAPWNGTGVRPVPAWPRQTAGGTP